MDLIPPTPCVLAVRTDFSDHEAWKTTVSAISQPAGEGLLANVEFLDDPAYTGMTAQQLRGIVPAGYAHSFLLVIDDLTISSRDHPVLVADVASEPGRQFRAVPELVLVIEHYLAAGVVGFADFAESADPDGIVRGS